MEKSRNRDEEVRMCGPEVQALIDSMGPAKVREELDAAVEMGILEVKWVEEVGENAYRFCSAMDMALSNVRKGNRRSVAQYVQVKALSEVTAVLKDILEELGEIRARLDREV